MLQLYPDQQAVYDDVQSAWGIVDNVLAVMPTGAGKTVLFGQVVHDEQAPAVAIAHRQELVGQISLTFARYGIKHRIVGPKNIIKLIVHSHMVETGRSWYDPSAPKGVAGVDTLLRRGDDLKQWMQTVRLWVQDEAHHVLLDNKWGKAAAMFPNARGLGVTAIPLRADGKGLGRHADGVFDYMAIGKTQRELIDADRLCEYRIFAPPSDLDLSDVDISKVTGDYNKDQLGKKMRQNRQIIGGIVEHYKRIADGRLGITFAVDVETATEIAAAYREAGVAAEVITAKTPSRTRGELLRRFRERKLTMLVNVDLFGEGFDVPAVEVVSMARPTESLNIFCQQFGRALRIMEGKERAIIIDHVGNTIRHGLPDAPREWSLDRRERKSAGKPDEGVIPVKACTSCSGVYERIYSACPYCGAVPVIADRSGPEFVDGDLCELDEATLAAMRGDVAKIDAPLEQFRARMEHTGVPPAGIIKACKNHTARQGAQTALRETIALWAGHQKGQGRTDTQSYRLFYHTFGTDVLSAQALGRPDAEALTARIARRI
jgi:superfamily II DNA or RNA helicase